MHTLVSASVSPWSLDMTSAPLAPKAAIQIRSHDSNIGPAALRMV